MKLHRVQLLIHHSQLGFNLIKFVKHVNRGSSCIAIEPIPRRSYFINALANTYQRQTEVGLVRNGKPHTNKDRGIRMPSDIANERHPWADIIIEWMDPVATLPASLQTLSL